MTQLLSILTCLTLLWTPLHSNKISNNPLQVEIKGFDTKPNCKIWVSVFSKDGFLKEPLQSKSIPVSGEKVSLTFDLPEGEYAVSTYQDLNNNGTLDRRFYGAPKEPYGFSNNVKPRFGPPKYTDCKFTVEENKKVITITLIN